MQKFSELRMTLIILVIGTFFISGCFFNNKHTVTFKTNGGTEISNVSVKSGNKIEKVKEPTKDGYVFDGWYFEGEEFDFDTKVKEDITLVAKWKKVEAIEEETTTITTTTETTTTTKKKISKQATTKKKTTKKKSKKTTTTTKKVDKVNAVVPPVQDKLEEDKKEETVKPGTTTAETVNPTTTTTTTTTTEGSTTDTSETTTTTTTSTDNTESTTTTTTSTDNTESTTTTTTTKKVDEENPTPDEPKEDEPVEVERNDKQVNLRIDATNFTPIEGGEEVQKVTIDKNITESNIANVYTLLSDEDINIILTSNMSKWNIKTNNNFIYVINQTEENISKLDLIGDNLKITSLTIEVNPTEVFMLEYVEKIDNENTKIIEWNLVRPVAETSTNSLDKQYHSDLQTAILSAPKDEVVTVKLLTDVEVKEEIEIHTPVIIDGDGYTITKEEGYLFNIDKLEYKEDDELNINNLDLKIDSMIKTGDSSFDKININNSEGIIKGETIENDEENRINLNFSNFYKPL